MPTLEDFYGVNDNTLAHIPKAPDDTRVTNHICQRCKGLALKRYYNETIDFCALSDLQDTYTRGCHLCVLFWNSLTKSHQADGGPEARLWLQHERYDGRTARDCLRISAEKDAFDPADPIYICEIAQVKLSQISGVREIIPTSSRSDQALWTIKSWFKRCLGHNDCKGFQREIGGKDLPSRLLDLRDGAVRLCCDPSKIADLRYMTLSHRWGNPQTLPQLTQDNLENYKEAIPAKILSIAFQEAIRVTLALGLQHLWIDALCIIQDSPEDWAREGKRMAGIYGGSTCNIAYVGDTLGTVDSTCRDPRLMKPCYLMHTVHLNSNGHDTVAQSFDGEVDEQRISVILDAPLSKRAWIFQERLLCPRTIYCGGPQLVWECLDGIQSELSGSIEKSVKSSFYSAFRFRRWSSNIERAAGRDGFNFSQEWSSLVMRYRKTELTYESDRVVALSGIVNAIQRLTGHTPFAGFWKETIVPDLCWAAKSEALKDGNARSRLPQLQVPSWSWLAAAPKDDDFNKVAADDEKSLWAASSKERRAYFFPETRFIYEARGFRLLPVNPPPVPPLNELSGAQLILQSFMAPCSLEWNGDGLQVQTLTSTGLEVRYWHDGDMESDLDLPGPLRALLLFDYIETEPPNFRCQMGLVIHQLEAELWRRVGLFCSIYKGEKEMAQMPLVHIPALIDIASLIEEPITLV